MTRQPVFFAASLLKGQHPLLADNPNEEFENPIHGILSYIQTKIGMHPMRAVRFWKDSPTTGSANALIQNHITKLESNSDSVSRGICRWQKRDNEHPPDRLMWIDFCAKTSQAENGVNELYQLAVARAKQGTALDVGVRIKKALLKHTLLPNIALRQSLKELYNATQRSDGN